MHGCVQTYVHAHTQHTEAHATTSLHSYPHMYIYIFACVDIITVNILVVMYVIVVT